MNKIILLTTASVICVFALIKQSKNKEYKIELMNLENSLEVKKDESENFIQNDVSFPSIKKDPSIDVNQNKSDNEHSSPDNTTPNKDVNLEEKLEESPQSIESMEAVEIEPMDATKSSEDASEDQKKTPNAKEASKDMEISKILNSLESIEKEAEYLDEEDPGIFIANFWKDFDRKHNLYKKEQIENIENILR